MRRILLAGALIGTLAGLSAQSVPINDLIFSLWPEYDHPGVLVLFSGKVDSADLPQKFEFLVPDQANRVLATGISDTSDQLLPVPIETRGSEKWVSVNIIRNSFQIEFYYNPFDDDHSRQVEYELKLGMEIPEFLLAIQKPFGSENFTLGESDMESFQDQHGMTFYRKQLPGLSANTSRTIDFQYENHTGETSIQQLQKMLSGQSPMMGEQMPPATSAKRHRLPGAEPIIIIIAVAVIVGFLFYRQNQLQNRGPSKGGNNKFCTKCGQPLQSRDKFCANCGTKVNAPGSV